MGHHAGVGGNTCASPAGGNKSYTLCIISCSISGICFSTPCFRLAPWSKADPIPPGLETSTLTLGMYPPARPCDNTDPTTYTDIVLHAVGHVPYMEKESVMDQAFWWALPVSNYICRVSFEASGPGGIRPAWGRGANQEQGVFGSIVLV